MNSFIRFTFILLISASFSSFIAAVYLFFFRDLQIFAAIFLIFCTITFYLCLSLLQSNKDLLTIDQKRILKIIFPPLLTIFLSKIINSSNKKEILFDGNEDIFKDYLSKSLVYAEYGMGASTIAAQEFKNLFIYSVDSDKNWVTNLKYNTKNERHLLKHIDLGDVLNWGMPKDYSKRENIKKYLNFPWEQNKLPDFVLIDGRFRVACFLTSLKNCKSGTIIIFDDYLERHHYHIVEKFIKPKRLFGKQAIFEVSSKEKLNIHEMDEMINKFEYVMQ
jgi:hypothetical protein